MKKQTSFIHSALYYILLITTFGLYKLPKSSQEPEKQRGPSFPQPGLFQPGPKQDNSLPPPTGLNKRKRKKRRNRLRMQKKSRKINFKFQK